MNSYSVMVWFFLSNKIPYLNLIVGADHSSNTGIAGFNPAEGCRDVSVHLSELCVSV